MNTPRYVEAYTLDALTAMNPLPVVAKRAPTGSDTGYIIGQVWIYTTNNAAYILTSVANAVANWQLLEVGGGAGTFTSLTVNPGPISLNGNLVLSTAGNKLEIATGTNASVGTTAAMTAGAITVATTAVTASSRIFVAADTPGGTQGILSIGTIIAGTSFVINSSSSSDTSTVNWLIIN